MSSLIYVMSCAGCLSRPLSGFGFLNRFVRIPGLSMITLVSF